MRRVTAAAMIGAALLLAGCSSSSSSSAGPASSSSGAAGSGGADFLTRSNQGTNTDFTLNNSIAVDNPSTTISDVIPGVTLNILQANPGGVGSVTVSLNSDPTQLSSALNTFAGDYNTLLTAVGAQTGTGAGALVGDPILSSIEGAMQQLVSSQGTGAVGDLYDLGIQMGDDGQMTLDSSVVNGFSASQLQSAFAWLGSTTTGLASFAASFTALGDPSTGAIQSEVSGYNTTDKNLQSQMLVKATQVSQMQASLQLRLAAQDTQIADLESQQNMLNTTIEAMNYDTYGYQQNPNG